jgi:3-methyladenine DNA glycosylase AlkC
MAEPFKHSLGEQQVATLAAALKHAWPRFDAATFTRLGVTGLDALELKARSRHLADALEQTLPNDAAAAFDVLTRSLGSVQHPDEGFGGDAFRYWPLSEYLWRHGPRDVPAALAANQALTQRFTAEFSLRSLLAHAREQTFAALAEWTQHDSPHVRRAVSESTRTRLPWGERVPSLITTPGPTLALLERLKDDPEEYVRRSVANNLNDLSKDHPKLVLDVARAWSSPGRRRLVEHALRTLVKAGDGQALAVLGVKRARLVATGRLSATRVKLGGAVTFEAEVHNQSKASTHVVVEVAVHFARPSGRASVKLFRLGRGEVDGGERRAFSKTLQLVDRSIRTLHAGVHVVELQVNGARQPLGQFALTR